MLLGKHNDVLLLILKTKIRVKNLRDGCCQDRRFPCRQTSRWSQERFEGAGLWGNMWIVTVFHCKLPIEAQTFTYNISIKRLMDFAKLGTGWSKVHLIDVLLRALCFHKKDYIYHCVNMNDVERGTMLTSSHNTLQIRQGAQHRL